MANEFNIVGIEGYADYDRVFEAVVISGDENVITMTKKGSFEKWVTNAIKTDTLTIGEMNRAELHKMLDRWIDGEAVDS